MIANVARKVTHEELSFYAEHGWVKLSGLIAREAAADLLAAAKELVPVVKATMRLPALVSDPAREHIVLTTPEWKGEWMNDERLHGFPGCSDFLAVRKIRLPPFLNFVFNKSIGRAVQQLLSQDSRTNAQIGVRYVEDNLTYVSPTDRPADDQPRRASNDTHPYFHQDTGMNRWGGINFWIALDEVTPEQAMKFLDKSFREGPLARSSEPLLDRYPNLVAKYDWSPPLHYLPGDVTVHHALTIHAGARAGTSPRWSYILSFVPAHTIPLDHTLGYSEPHEKFPVVYP